MACFNTPSSRLAITLAAAFAALATHTHAALTSIPLAGTGADGYFAVVNVNQEAAIGGTTGLDPIDNTPVGISDDPADAKFFDYPAYINPLNPNAIYIMYVEPYRFGLDYPDPLFPTSPVPTFTGVGNLQQRNPDGTAPAGATFVDAFTEDADFADFDLGSIDYDDSSLTGIGTEFIAAQDLTLTLDGSEFESQNRTKLNPADAGFGPTDPIGTVNPEGRSNRNEAANSVNLTATDLTGTGLTFTDGVLSSIDFVADIDLNVSGAGLTGGGIATGTLTFTGLDFAFDVDSVGSTAFASNVRVLLNRSGTVPVPALPGDFDNDGDVDADDIDLLLTEINGSADPAFDLTGDGITNADDLTELIEVILATRPGDANLDGQVGTPDLAILASNFGTQATSWANANFNGLDGVGTPDLAILAASFGFGTTPVSAATPAIPEPATLAITALGALGLARRRPSHNVR
ncbi:MAG: PEP-CTERM sorting domain-containing protein [Planctomycetota bacterium]